jgi:ATP-dependent Lon protease
MTFASEQTEMPHLPTRWALTTDTGWKITIDRGLDIFQKFESGPFSIEQGIQEARLTRGAEITYLKNTQGA